MPLDNAAAGRVRTATLNYLERTQEKPTRYITEPPEGRPQWNGVNAPHQMQIEDVRGRESAFSLDSNGFAFLQAPTQVPDFYEPEQIARIYYPEVEALLRRTLGASRVHVFDHNVRNGAPASVGGASVKEPVQRVHNDYTYRSAPQRVHDLLPAEADGLLQQRFAIVNVWRPIRGPVLESPLALCDAGSFTDDDLLGTDLVYADRVGETFSVSYNPAHRWYFLSGMQPDEALLIKCFDSATDGRARLSFHSAFIDPAAPEDAPKRESIEVRTLVFFPPA